MNRTKIEYVNFSWSPVTGCYGPKGTEETPAPCFYCYARRMARRFGKTEAERNFEPAFHPDRLDAPFHHKKPARIFVCTVADLFGDWVPEEWITQVLAVASQASQHTFFFLTKNPQRMQDFTFPSNAWAGTTVEDTAAIMRVANLVQVRAEHKWLSIEPMLGPILSALGPYLAGHNWGGKRSIGWVVVGAQSGPGATPPMREWVEDLVAQCRQKAIKVWMKNNLAAEWNGGVLRQELPPC